MRAMIRSHHDDRVRHVFDEWAGNGRAEGMERGHGPAAREALEHLRLAAGSRYLDIGCGNGYTVRWAAELCAPGTAMGIDISPEMIARARKLSGRLDNTRFHLGRFPEVDLDDQFFDGILSVEALYYVPDLPAALARIRELLAPKGRFACVVDYYAENTASHVWAEELGLPLTLLSEAGWRGALETEGLEILGQERVRRESAPSGQEWKCSEGSLLTLARRAD
jgi:SAM-dependent methyltransferase